MTCDLAYPTSVTSVNTMMTMMMMMMRMQGVSKGWTPLSWACHRGNKDAVELLLSNGASVADLDNQVSQVPCTHAYRLPVFDVLVVVSVYVTPHCGIGEWSMANGF